MRIAVLHSGDLEKISPGGVTQYVKQLIKYCDNNEITVFGTADYNVNKTGIPQKRKYAGKEYTFIPISTNKRRPLSVFYFLKEFRYLKLLKKYDVIFSQRMEYSIPFVFSKIHKQKLYQIIHGSIKYSIDFYGKWIGFLCLILEKISIKTAKKTFVILQREEVGVPFYQNKYFKQRRKILYGKVPIDTKLFRVMDRTESRKKLGIPIESKVLLYVGRIDHDPKRILFFPEIVRELIKEIPDLYFYIVGDGEDYRKLENKVKEFHLEKNMKMTGYVEAGEQLCTYLSASDCTINISRFEGTCTSTLESIACGRPIVTTDVGDVERYMSNGQNGIIIPNDNDVVESAIQALRQLLSRPCNMNEVFKLYDGDTVIRELKEIFEGSGENI